MQLGFFLCLFDIFLAHIARVLDGNRLLFASAFVLGSNVKNTISVDIKRHFNLRHAARCWRDTVKHKAPQTLVIIGKFALTLQDMDLHLRLIIGSRREHFALAGRHSGITLDQLGRHAAHRLNTKAQRRHVQQQHILDVASQHAALNGCTNSHHFVWVNALHRIFAEQLLHPLDHCWHTSHTANHHHVLDV